MLNVDRGLGEVMLKYDDIGGISSGESDGEVD